MFGCLPGMLQHGGAFSEALRKQSLARLQAKHRDPGAGAQQEAKHREAEMRNSI